MFVNDAHMSCLRVTPQIITRPVVTLLKGVGAGATGFPLKLRILHKYANLHKPYYQTVANEQNGQPQPPPDTSGPLTLAGLLNSLHGENGESLATPPLHRPQLWIDVRGWHLEDIDTIGEAFGIPIVAMHEMKLGQSARLQVEYLSASSSDGVAARRRSSASSPLNPMYEGGPEFSQKPPALQPFLHLVCHAMAVDNIAVDSKTGRLSSKEKLDRLPPALRSHQMNVIAMTTPDGCNDVLLTVLRNPRSHLPVNAKEPSGGTIENIAKSVIPFRSSHDAPVSTQQNKDPNEEMLDNIRQELVHAQDGFVYVNRLVLATCGFFWPPLRLL